MGYLRLSGCGGGGFSECAVVALGGEKLAGWQMAVRMLAIDAGVRSVDDCCINDTKLLAVVSDGRHEECLVIPAPTTLLVVMQSRHGGCCCLDRAKWLGRVDGLTRILQDWCLTSVPV